MPLAVSLPSRLTPIVKVWSCRSEVQPELLQQVLMFMLQNKWLGMVEVCEFLRPLLNFSITRLSVSESSSSTFAMQLESSMVSFCCSFPSESMPVFKLLIGCLKYLPHKTSEDYRKLIFVVEHVVEAFIVVLKSLAGKKSLITEAQLCAVEFLETIFSLCTCLLWQPGGHEPIFELSRRLLSVQKDLALQWVPGLSSTMVSLFIILVQSELEHEQISILKLLLLIHKWKYNNDDAVSRTKSTSVEEILFVLPVISLMSSPSKSVKGLATDLLFLLEKILVKTIVALKDKPIIEEGVHYLSTPGVVVSRLLRLLWYQDGESYSRISLLNLALNGMNDSEMMHDRLISWVSELKIFEMLPSLASHSAMIPLVVQTILPMLKDAKVSLQQLDCCVEPGRSMIEPLQVCKVIESQDPIIKALGLQSLAHLCEADVIDNFFL